MMLSAMGKIKGNDGGLMRKEEVMDNAGLHQRETEREKLKVHKQRHAVHISKYGNELTKQINIYRRHRNTERDGWQRKTHTKRHVSGRCIETDEVQTLVTMSE